MAKIYNIGDKTIIEFKVNAEKMLGNYFISPKFINFFKRIEKRLNRSIFPCNLKAGRSDGDFVKNKWTFILEL